MNAMNRLFRDEIMHFLASFLIAIFFANAFREPSSTFIGAFLGGFLIDADHLLDHYLAFGLRNFKLRDFLSGKAFEKSQKVYVVFHGWEYPLILSFLTYLFIENKTAAALCISFAVSLLFHLVIDTLTNQVTPLGYSFLYRYTNHFRRAKISLHPRQK